MATSSTLEIATSSKSAAKSADTTKEVDCSRSILPNFVALRNNDTLSDITLEVGSKRISTHRLILTTVSPVFREMFKGNWKENEDNSAKLQETAECEQVFETFLDFLYGCNNGVIPLSIDNVVPLLTLADKYQVLGLKDLCSKFMETLIEGDIKLAFSWLSFAEEKQLASVADRCYDVICWNLKKAATYPAWKTISFENLLVILKREDVVVHTEYDVFVAAETWLTSKDSEAGCKFEVAQILPYIEFKNMTMEELQSVEKSPMAKMAEKTDDPSVLKRTVIDAVGFRALETESRFTMNSRRRYLVGLKHEKATHLNSVTLDCEWPESVDNIQMRCDFTFEYSHDTKMFRIVVFRKDKSRSRYVASAATACRVVGFFLVREKKTEVIHHFLNCNAVTQQISHISDGDCIFEFPKIQCLDYGQFKGHYLGKFELLYKVAVIRHKKW